MTDPQVALMMLGHLHLLVFLGFPIAFTLMAMGIGFGYYAYFDAGRMWRAFNRLDEEAGWWESFTTWVEGFFNNRIFDLFINQTYTVMSNEVLTAVPLFLFMGYIVERANIVDRLFGTLNIAAKNVPGSMGVAALITCALFATATGIVGAVVTLMGLLALPAMLKARYDKSFASGIICAGGTLGILIPPSIMLIVYAASSGVSIVRLYAGALLPGLTLVGLYLVYVIGRSILQPSVAPKPTRRRCPTCPSGKLVWMLMLTSFLPLAFLILAVLGSILFGLATPDRGGLDRRAGRHLPGFAYRAMTFAAAARIGLPDGAHHGDGLLALRRLLHLLVGVLLSRRRASDLGVRAGPRPDAAAVPDPGAAHHLPARLAAGMVRDHHHLRADLPAAAAALRDRPAVLRHPGGAEPADQFLTPPMAMSAYYLKGIAPPEVQLTQIFRGVMPFLFMVFISMVLIYIFPQIVFYLPRLFYG
jgi:TRAP-type mannitol/chloroaromatic compound transport system permease large subunit